MRFFGFSPTTTSLGRTSKSAAWGFRVEGHGANLTEFAHCCCVCAEEVASPKDQRAEEAVLWQSRCEADVDPGPRSTKRSGSVGKVRSAVDRLVASPAGLFTFEEPEYLSDLLADTNTPSSTLCLSFGSYRQSGFALAARTSTHA